MTLGFSVGVGYSFAWTSYTNKDLQNRIDQNGSTEYYDYYDYTTNMFNHLRFGDRSAFAITNTITLGYIFK